MQKIRSFAAFFLLTSIGFIVKQPVFSADQPILAPDIPYIAHVANGASENIDLNGQWRFRLEPGSNYSTTSTPAPPAPEKADSWSLIHVPGSWEMQGYAEPRYDRDLVDAIGIYETEFEWNQSTDINTIVLQFEGVLNGFKVFLNGNTIGQWSSAYNRSQFNVSEYLLLGKNVLRVEVETKPENWLFDINDAWSFSGIFRDVSLLVYPRIYVSDLSVTTELESSKSAKVTFAAEIDGKTLDQGNIGFNTSLSFAGELVAEASEKEFQSGELIVDVLNPKLWTAETPHLYDLTVTVTQGNVPIQTFVQAIGIRQITIEQGQLLLNGTPIKLRGINRHDISPTGGRTFSEQELQQDMELIKQANMNFIRTAHYPSDSRLYEMADRMGIYIMDEVPFGRGDENLANPNVLPELLERATATIRRDKNHPSVIIWSLGNENPLTDVTLKLGQFVKVLDGSRPICYPMMNSQFADHRDELPAFVDIYAPHYPSMERLLDYAENLKDRPVILTEYTHAMGLNFGSMNDTWQILKNRPNFAGGAVWHFSDQGIGRQATQTFDRNESTDVVWKDASYFFDSASDRGMDGIVYADRTLQEDFYQMRSVYAPVSIVERQIEVDPDQHGIELTLQNDFDFRSTENINVNWSLLKNRQVIDSGIAIAIVDAGQKGELFVPTMLSGLTDGVTRLKILFVDEDGRQLNEQTIRINLGASTNKMQFDQIVNHYDRDKFEISVEENSTILNVSMDSLPLLSGLFARVGRVQTMVDLRHQSQRAETGLDYHWDPKILTPTNVRVLSKENEEEISRVTLQAEFERILRSGSEQTLLATFSFESSDSGLTISYRIVPAADTALSGVILEGGVSLGITELFHDLRWVGNGPFADYPGKRALNNYDIHEIHRDDLYFQGNRSGVELAALTTDRGASLLVIPISGNNVAVERSDDGLIISHNALVSSRGAKSNQPLTLHEASADLVMEGSFKLVPVDDEMWEEELIHIFGDTDEEVVPYMPFAHSYDQN